MLLLSLFSISEVFLVLSNLCTSACGVGASTSFTSLVGRFDPCPHFEVRSTLRPRLS